MDSPQVNRCIILMKSHIHLHFQIPSCYFSNYCSSDGFFPFILLKFNITLIAKLAESRVESEEPDLINQF